MSFTVKAQHLLIKAADVYVDKGYRVGLCKGKNYKTEFIDSDSDFYGYGIDSISIILHDLVCVDFDDATSHLDLSLDYDLPVTMKESTRRGCHIFYRLPTSPTGSIYKSRIAWKRSIDLLVFDGETTPYNGGTTPYNGGTIFYGHALVSPSPNYIRICPDQTPERDKLPMAPDWLVATMST